MKCLDNVGYHRAQALYFQFRTYASKDQNYVSLTEYLHIAL